MNNMVTCSIVTFNNMSTIDKTLETLFEFTKDVDFKIYEIDRHNIIPARYISNKQEYSAMTLRKKIYQKISFFLTEFDNFTQEKTEAELALNNFIKVKPTPVPDIRHRSGF